MSSGDRIRPFVRGGMWRNFLSRYPESNQIQKMMFAVSLRWHDLSRAGLKHEENERLLREARTHVLASQCNDAYWHGVFGGLYAPHLRTPCFTT